MKKEFVPYELALRLKELGFDEPCITFYPVDLTLPLVGIYATLGFNGKHSSLKDGYRNSTVNILWTKKYKRNFANVAAPTFSQAFRWFREKHNLMFQIFYLRNGNHAALIHRTTPEYMDLVDQVRPSSGCLDEVVDCDSYEEAELACLDKLLEIVENKSE
jgi:hypothetical protein